MEAALEQYLILAKSAKGRACEALIMQAISNPKTFVFGELLDAVHDGGISKEAQKILEIFTYGTLSDYRNEKLPDLNPQQLKKLQMLTLASLASENSIISYRELLSVLEITSTRQLEDLIIDSIYEGLIKGKIDHKNSCLRVFECYGRDLKPENVLKTLDKIKNYIKSVDHLEAAILKNIDSLQATKSLGALKKEQFDKVYTETKASIKACVNTGKEGDSMLSKLKKQFHLGTN